MLPKKSLKRPLQWEVLRGTACTLSDIIGPITNAHVMDRPIMDAMFVAWVERLEPAGK
jgi:hypothetical protein